MPLFNPIEAFKKYFQAIFNATADKVVTNSVAETSAFPTGIGNRTIDPNWLQPGRSVRVIANGMYSAAALPPTLTVRVKIGNVTVAQGTAASLLSLASNLGWDMSCTITCRTEGANGTVSAGGRFSFAVAGGGRQFVDLLNTSTATIDTTSAQQLDVTVQWSGLGSTSITTKIATIEQLEN